MTKAKKKAAPRAPKEEVSISYACHDGGTHTATLKVPPAPGHGEAIINEAGRRGCKDISAVRAAVAKHY